MDVRDEPRPNHRHPRHGLVTYAVERLGGNGGDVAGQNCYHTFHSTLSAIRREAKRTADELPVWAGR